MLVCINRPNRREKRRWTAKALSRVICQMVQDGDTPDILIVGIAFVHTDLGIRICESLVRVITVIEFLEQVELAINTLAAAKLTRAIIQLFIKLTPIGRLINALDLLINSYILFGGSSQIELVVKELRDLRDVSSRLCLNIEDYPICGVDIEELITIDKVG